MLLSETRVTDANGRLLTDCRSQTSPLFSGAALGILPTMARRKIAHNKPQRPRIGKRRLGEMIEAATVDSNSESEQLMGWLMMIGDNLAVPFETTVLGVPVVVERIDLNRSDQIIAVCRRGRERQSLPILDLPLPTPPPDGADWIEAYRSWLGGG
jgi:hypothetical protein